MSRADQIFLRSPYPIQCKHSNKLTLSRNCKLSSYFLLKIYTYRSISLVLCLLSWPFTSYKQRLRCIFCKWCNGHIFGNTVVLSSPSPYKTKKVGSQILSILHSIKLKKKANEGWQWPCQMAKVHKIPSFSGNVVIRYSSWSVSHWNSILIHTSVEYVRHFLLRVLRCTSSLNMHLCCYMQVSAELFHYCWDTKTNDFCTQHTYGTLESWAKKHLPIFPSFELTFLLSPYYSSC